MTEKYICIGGPWNGQCHFQPSGDKVLKVMEFPEDSATTDISEWGSFEDAVSYTLTYYHLYTIRVGAEASFAMWKHESITGAEVIKRLLTVYEAFYSKGYDTDPHQL